MDETLKQEPIKKFSDIMKKTTFEGERVDAASLLNRELKILDYVVIPSDKFRAGGKFGVISAIIDSKLIHTNVSETVADQLEKNIERGMLPILATLVMRKSAKTGQMYQCLE